MAFIQRPVKTLGNREYAQEKAANPNEPIKSAEVDGDLDTIYALVNGQLDTANLKASANILGTQLAPGANILGSQLSPTAGITAGQLAPGTLTGAQLAVGAAVRHFSYASTVALTTSTSEGTFVTVPLTTSGGYVIFGGWWDATVNNLGTTGTVTIRVKRDGTVVNAIGPTFSTPAGTPLTWLIPSPWVIDVETAAAHTYTITMQTSTASITVATTANGIFWALELA